MAEVYPVGTKIVHPSYGAGTVVEVQEKSIGDMRQEYYVIDTVPSPRAMQVMVPVSKAEEIGLRKVGRLQELREMLSSLPEPLSDEEVENDFRSRKSMLQDLLKSGTFTDVAEAVYILRSMTTWRRLCMTDRKMFDKGKEMLAAELALASGQDLGDAMAEVEGCLKQMVDKGKENGEDGN